MFNINIVSNVFFNLNENQVKSSGVSYYKTRVHIFGIDIEGRKYSEIKSREQFQDFLLDEITIIKIANKMEYTQNLLKEIINK